MNPNNRNLESICLEICNLSSSVFYPGDTKNYMYYPFLTNYDYFIASHHGGSVGKLNLQSIVFKNVIVNTHTKNISTYRNKYRQSYLKHTSNLVEGAQNNGTRLIRVRL